MAAYLEESNRSVESAGGERPLLAQAVDGGDRRLVSEQGFDVGHLGRAPHLDRRIGRRAVQFLTALSEREALLNTT